MELWIRTQDKKLLRKSERLCVVEDLKEYYIVDNDDIYGKYKTRKRALEVLDEIQKMLDGRWIKEKMPSASMQNIFPIMFYEMPKE